MNALAVKIILAVIMTCIMLGVWFTADRWQNKLPKNWATYVIGLIIFSRMVILFVALIVLKVTVAGNIDAYWQNNANIHAGLVPFRDYASVGLTLYNPLFYYILAIAQNTFQLSVLLSLSEILTFLLIFRMLSTVLSTKQLHLWSILYLCSPAALWWSTLGGHIDVIILGFYTLAFMYFIQTKKASINSLLGGFIMAFGFLATKITSILFLPFVFGFSPMRRRTIIGYLLMGLVFTPLYLLMGPHLLQFLTGIGGLNLLSAPSLWIILNALTDGKIPATSGFYSILMVLAVWGTGFVLILYYENNKRFTKDTRVKTLFFVNGWCILWSIANLLNPYGHVDYFLSCLAFALVLLVLQPKNKWLVAAVMLVNILLIIEESLYYRSQIHIYTIYTDLFSLGMFTLDLIILISYGIIGLSAITALVKLQTDFSSVNTVELSAI